MTIFKDKTGQLANNLFEFATFIALSVEKKSWVLNTTFNSHSAFFRGSHSPINFRFRTLTFFSNSKINSFILSIFLDVFESFSTTKILKGNNQPIGISDLPSGLVVKTGGWFTSFDKFYSSQDFLREYFRPIGKVENQIVEYLGSHKKPSKVLIGVHIRRGDYKEFLDGKFYYDNSVYIQKMSQIVEAFEGREVQFMIASNEDISDLDFKQFDYFKAPNHYLKDLYALAECDYLIGPPSTFTMWASFYGKKPLQKIYSQDQKMTFNAFELDYGY